MARTVLIVDDHAGFRAQARALLERAGYDVAGEADDGTSGLDAVRTLRADVVLLDVQLPNLTGFDVAKRILEPTRRRSTGSSADRLRAFRGRPRRPRDYRPG